MEMIYRCMQPDERSVDIPEGFTVIGEKAFGDNDVVEEVLVPASVRKIAYRAFDNCPNLKSIRFKGELESIEMWAFTDCTALTELIIPEGIEILGPIFRFNHFNPAIEYIHLPKSLKKVDMTRVNGSMGALLGLWPQYMSSLKELDVDKDNPRYAVENGWFLDKKTGEALMLQGAGEIPEGALEISVQIMDPVEGMVIRPKETVLRVPETVYAIRTDFFGFSEIVFEGKSIQFVQPWYDHSHLDSLPVITAPRIPLSFFENTPLKRTAAIGFARYMVNGGAAEPEIEAEYLDYIRRQRKNLPDDGMLAYLTKKGVIKSGSKEYEKARLQKEWGWKNEDGQITITEYKGSGPEVEVPSFIEGKPVTAIGPWAFGSTVAQDVLVNQRLSDTYTNFRYHSVAYVPVPIPRLSAPTRENRQKITKITLPKSIEYIGQNAFRNCLSLQEIDLPEKLKTIDEAAFLGCNSLRSVTIPDHCEFYDACFAECKSLQSIRWPKDLQMIPWGTLRGCSSIENITIPETVQEIGYEAFAFCTSLKEIRIPASVKVIRDAAFSGNNSLHITVHPANKLFSIQNEMLTDSDGRLISACSGKIIPDTIKTIGEGAFMESDIIRITFPESVESIGPYAFAGSALSEICWNSRIEEIPEGTFYGCGNLTRIEIPSNIRTIGHSAFYCYGTENKLQTLILNEGVREIGMYAFDWQFNYDFEKLVLPESLETVGHFAFSDCSMFKIYARASKPSEGWGFYDSDRGRNIGILRSIIYNYKG